MARTGVNAVPIAAVLSFMSSCALFKSITALLFFLYSFPKSPYSPSSVSTISCCRSCSSLQAARASLNASSALIPSATPLLNADNAFSFPPRISDHSSLLAEAQFMASAIVPVICPTFAVSLTDSAKPSSGMESPYFAQIPAELFNKLLRFSVLVSIAMKLDTVVFAAVSSPKIPYISSNIAPAFSVLTPADSAALFNFDILSLNSLDDSVAATRPPTSPVNPAPNPVSAALPSDPRKPFSLIPADSDSSPVSLISFFAPFKPFFAFFAESSVLSSVLSN